MKYLSTSTEELCELHLDIIIFKLLIVLPKAADM